MASHLLDTSAVLAHYFNEAGATEVDALWSVTGHRIAICVLSLPEFRSRLRQEINDVEEIERAYRLYADHLTDPIPIDRGMAEKADEIRKATQTRIPLIDAVIAACASLTSSILVHRDPHMDCIPTSTVKQLRLPDT
jgi:predicted nucleic acid-binding protein